MDKSGQKAKKPARKAPARRDPRDAGDAAPRFYYKGSRLKQLRAFCMIVKLGTLSRAAEALFLSQPSISLQLRALEDELGVALIERRRRRVAPTREGQALYELALPLVDGLESLDRRFHARCEGLSGGELRIAAGASTGQYLLPAFVAAFRERHADVHLQLRTVVGSDGIAQLRADQVDLAVGSLLDVPNDLGYEPLQTFDPMLIAPLSLYLDAPDLSVLGSKVMQSKTASVVLEGPVTFLPDGRINISAVNLTAVTVTISTSVGNIVLTMPAGDMGLQVISKPLRGGPP